jgi:hypothetical protein
MDLTKSVLGHVMFNLVFCIRCDLLVTYCIPVRPGSEMSMQYFSWSGGLGAVSIRSALEHVAQNLCFCIL